MSPAQFRRRTSMLGLPGEIYDRYDRIVKSCKICSTSVPSPPRARIAGLRASSFGDLIFVDHAEINYGVNSYLVLLVIDGATNLLWATALKSLDSPETLGALRLWIVPDEDMPYDDPGDDSPDLGGTGGGPFGPGPGPPGNQGGNDPDLPPDEIEFQYGPGGNPPPHYPGGGASIPVPDDSDSSMELIPDGAYGPSPDDDHPPYPMEVHTEPPPPGGPPDAPGQNSLLRTRTKLCNRHLTCHRPLLSRLFHFRSIHIFRFQESCVRHHRGMFR